MKYVSDADSCLHLNALSMQMISYFSLMEIYQYYDIVLSKL